MSLSSVLINQRGEFDRIFARHIAPPSITPSPTLYYCDHRNRPEGYTEVGAGVEFLIRCVVARYFPTMARPFFMPLQGVAGIDSLERKAEVAIQNVQSWIDGWGTDPHLDIVMDAVFLTRLEAAGRHSGTKAERMRLISGSGDADRVSSLVASDVANLLGKSNVLGRLDETMGSGKAGLEVAGRITFGQASYEIRGADADLAIINGGQATLVDIVCSNYRLDRVWERTWPKLLGYAALWQINQGYRSLDGEPVTFDVPAPTHLAMWSVRHDRLVTVPFGGFERSELDQFEVLMDEVFWGLDDFDFWDEGPAPIDSDDMRAMGLKL